jgi:hypothetical protein
LTRAQDGGLDRKLGNVFAVHLHNQWDKTSRQMVGSTDYCYAGMKISWLGKVVGNYGVIDYDLQCIYRNLLVEVS